MKRLPYCVQQQIQVIERATGYKGELLRTNGKHTMMCFGACRTSVPTSPSDRRWVRNKITHIRRANQAARKPRHSENQRG